MNFQMSLNYKIKKKTEKVGLYNQSWSASQTGNSKITQIVGI